MAARLISTAIMLLLAGGGFFGGVLLPAGALNPFGIVFLALSGVFWFGWEMIEDAYAYQEENRRATQALLDPMLMRFGPILGSIARRNRLH